jgi:lysophospholipid acyltransferase (LPLAT)-like uncharacterized protein
MAASTEDRIHELEGTALRRIRFLGRTLRCWQRTLRFEGIEKVRHVISGTKGGAVFLLWHNRLFPWTAAFHEIDLEGRAIHGLVSASRDGAKLAAFMESQGIHPIRGSSSRRGTTATRQLLRVLRDGGVVAITVDGPRGPCYHAHAGAATLLQLTGAPAVLLGAEPEAAWQLNSWDRFLVPQPFSRIRLKARRWRESNPTDLRSLPREEVRKALQSGLMGLTLDQQRWR